MIFGTPLSFIYIFHINFVTNVNLSTGVYLKFAASKGKSHEDKYKVQYVIGPDQIYFSFK
jgi:hypothetical protein